MRIGILGDCHFTAKTPCKRTDNFFETQLSKLKECLSIFKSNNCDIIIQSGDFFDTPAVGNYVISEIIKVLNTCDVPIYCIFGQHDVVGHSEFTYYRSPLNVLESAGCVKLLSDTPTYVELNTMMFDSTFKLYGASFGKEIIEVKDGFNVLVVHRMIGDRKLYNDQEIEYPNEFLQKYKYNLIICGDYHYSFKLKFNNRWIINAGCLVRKTVSENDLKHEPSCVIYDSVKNDCEFFKLQSAKSIEEVFDLSVKEDTVSLEIENFVSSLFENNGSNVDWKNILYAVLKEKDVNKNIYNEIEDSLMKIGVDK